MEVALKLIGSDLDPFQITFLRFLLGGLVLLPFAIHEYKGKPKGYMTKTLWLKMLFLGTVNICVSMILFQFGLNHSNAATAAVIFCSNPIFTMLFAHLMTKDDKLNRNKMIALALGVTGIIFMIRPWDMQEGNTLIGAVLSLSAAAVFGFYTVAGSKTLGIVGPFTQTTSSFLMGDFVLLLIMLPTGRPLFEGVSDNILLIIYISVVVTGLGYLSFFLGIKHSNATTGSTTFLLKPVIAPVFAVIVIGETIAYNTFIGIAFTLAASWILIFRKNAVIRDASE